MSADKIQEKLIVIWRALKEKVWHTSYIENTKATQKKDNRIRSFSISEAAQSVEQKCSSNYIKYEWKNYMMSTETPLRLHFMYTQRLKCVLMTYTECKDGNMNYKN